ncbi:MAG: PAS domain S-box protein [Verrucomicrobia bacterium]|nr:PAS domain S-box protein [Verrucomicrobiota bacterium]
MSKPKTGLIWNAAPWTSRFRRRGDACLTAFQVEPKLASCAAPNCNHGIVAVADTDDSSPPVSWLMSVEYLMSNPLGEVEMEGHDMTRDQLIVEVSALKERAADLESSKEGLKRTVEALRGSQEVERRLIEENQLLTQTGQIVSSTLDIDEVYERFAAQMKKLVDFDRLAINIIDHEAGVFVFKYVSGLVQPGRQVPDVVALPNTQTEHVIATGRTLIRGNLVSDRQFAGDSSSVKLGFRSTIMLPLFHKGRILGTLSLRSRKINAFGSREQSILERLSDYIAPAMENAELYSQRTKAEVALRESEERYRSLFEESGDPVFISSQGIIVDANQAALDEFGFSREEAIGSNVEDRFVDPEDRTRFRKEMEQSGFVTDFEAQLRKKDGTVMDCLLTANRRPSSDGTAQGEVQGIVHDITDRKRAEDALRASEERYRELVETAQDVIFTASPEGMFTSINPAFESLTGWSRSEWLGKPFAELIHPDDLPQSLEMFHRVLGGERPPMFERRVLVKSGEYITGEFLTTPQLHDGKVVGIFGVARDISERKRAEEELLQQTRELAVLEERNRMAREIHDTMAQGFTGIVLQMEAAEQIMEDSTGALAERLNRARALAREGLQEARRSVWGLMPQALERLPFDAALQEEVRRFDAEGQEKTAFNQSGKRRELPPDVQTVLLRICQESLINVRRHAEAKEVSVNLEYHPQEVLLSVQDNGVGFDPATVQNEKRGVSFGLIGMRQRAEQLEAQLVVESTKNKGTLVQLTIPTL